MPRVSVLLPARNEADLIAQALAGLLDDPWRDLEVLVIDDGSSDSTPEIVNDWSRRDARVRLVRGPARGLAPALETGRALARGEFIARMDADDLSLPGRLTRQVEALLADPALGLVAGRVRVETLDGSAPGPGMLRYVAWQNELLSHDEHCRDLFVESPLVHPSVMMRASLLEEAGGYRDGDFPEDYDLWMRLLIGSAQRPGGRGHVGQGARIRKLDGAPVLVWRERARRFTRLDPRCRPEAFRALKVRYLLQSYLDGRREAVVWGAGIEGKPLAKLLLAAGLSLRAFVEVDPRKIGQRIYGAPVLPVSALPSVRGCFVLGAVGSPGARALLREGLRGAGFTEGLDACLAV
jgi:glycosyltransferase involved in cell wall biosynthesis